MNSLLIPVTVSWALTALVPCLVSCDVPLRPGESSAAQRFLSPDGRREAMLYIRDGGATAGELDQ